MSSFKTYSFSADLKIIGVNPYVLVPDNILLELKKDAAKEKGPIPICGTINKKPYIQTLVKFAGVWRLYINTGMLKNSPKRIGEVIALTLSFDPAPRTVEAPALFTAALQKEKEAKRVFDSLSASRQHEIVRYLARLKSEEVLIKNIERAIQFLLGKARFVGRDKP